MIKSASVIGITTFALLLTPVAQSATEMWSTDGFVNPESAPYDTARSTIYVSNVNGEPTKKDGAGHISRLGTDGKMQDAEWVTGLNAPKGLCSTTTCYICLT